jgi:hypothetical protein
MEPHKISKPLKKNYFLRVNHMMVPAKMKFNPLKKFTLLVQTRLCSKRKDEFLAYHLLVYIEKEIYNDFTTEIIMD